MFLGIKQDVTVVGALERDAINWRKQAAEEYTYLAKWGDELDSSSHACRCLSYAMQAEELAERFAWWRRL